MRVTFVLLRGLKDPVKGGITCSALTLLVTV